MICDCQMRLRLQSPAPIKTEDDCSFADDHGLQWVDPDKM